jgi:LacI family transcriptional regulator
MILSVFYLVNLTFSSISVQYFIYFMLELCDNYFIGTIMEKNNKERVTLKDIAERAGVTVNSVSRALRGHKSISEVTKEKVRAIAKELGYIPDAQARLMRGAKLRVIAVVYDNIVNPYYSIMNNHLNNELTKANYRPMVFFESSQDGTLSLEVAREIISMRIVGVITYLVPTKEVIDLFEDHNVPIVLLGRTGDSLGIDSVATNDYRGGKLAGYKLFDLGGKNFSYIGVTRSLNINKERLNGFLKALQNNDVAVPKSNIILNDKRQSTRSLMEELDVKTKKIDSIFCFNDQIAYEVIGYLGDNGIKVPDDINVIGFDNLQSDIIYPIKLTTIDGDKPRAAHLALNILFSKIKNESDTEMTGKIVDVTLVEGKTTKMRK